MKTLFSATMVAALCTALLAPRSLAQGVDATQAPLAPIPVLPPATNVAPAAPSGEAATATNAPAKPTKKKSASKPATKPASKTAASKSKSTAPDVKSEPVLSPEPAVARQNNVNVRGQASINSEVVTHLKKGDAITVLEEVTLKSPKQDEPARWYRIAVPTNVSVWVHSSFVDSSSGTVKANRLNLRGGPGENYSVVGRLDKGAAVKVIDTKGSWMKIEPPTNAYAFVAAHLVDRTPGAAIAAAKPVPPPVVEKPATTTPPPAVTPIPEPVAPPPTVAAVTPAPVAEAAKPEPVVAPKPAPAETPAVATTTPAPAITPTPAPAETETTPAAPIETVRKIVSREGILKGSVSIQAPSHYELRSLDTGKAIDYVFSASTNLMLKEFKGQRVIVTGEEVLDERWQNTPVLVVETLQTVP